MRRRRSGRGRGRLVLSALLATFAWLAAPALAAQDDLSLRQRLARDQAIAGDEKVLATGHVDVGPKFLGGRWTLMVHDDTAKSITGGPSVWRHPERTVLRVNDAAVREVPDDPTYSFLHAEPGASVYVVPETQDPEVVWVGWNTQDPEVMERIDRGVRMALTGVQGPGGLVVYLQSGDFSEPDVLWDSTATPNPIWVDVNTHTHANWVFSKPGVYAVRVRVEADLIDGSTVADSRALRFAVGSHTAPGEALAAAWQGPVPGEPSNSSEPSRVQPANRQGSGPSPELVAALVLAALGLAGALAVVLVRGKRVKRRARS